MVTLTCWSQILCVRRSIRCGGMAHVEAVSGKNQRSILRIVWCRLICWFGHVGVISTPLPVLMRFDDFYAMEYQSILYDVTVVISQLLTDKIFYCFDSDSSSSSSSSSCCCCCRLHLYLFSLWCLSVSMSIQSLCLSVQLLSLAAFGEYTGAGGLFLLLRSGCIVVSAVLLHTAWKPCVLYRHREGSASLRRLVN